MIGIIITCAVAFTLLIVLKVTFLFILLALLPTLVAYFTDVIPGKPSFKAVGACNLAATLPTVVLLVQFSLKNEFTKVYTEMSKPMVWLFIYGGAAAGWGLLYLCRFVARLIIALKYEYNVMMLEKAQKSLLDEWGSDIKQRLITEDGQPDAL